MGFLTICGTLLTVLAERQCQSPHDRIGASSEHLSISESSIHGRGVILTRPVKKDSKIGILYYEEEVSGVEFTPSIIEGYWHARGYITDGGKIESQTMTVREALARCNELPKCQGITFEDREKEFVNPEEISDEEVEIEFKDKAAFGADEDWQSFIQHTDKLNLGAIYFPLGCSSFFLPNPPPASLDPERMLPCWPRYVNHSCTPTTTVVKEPVEEGFVLPGIEWRKILFALQVVALEDLNAGDEITLNYELLPDYMLQRVDGVDACAETVHP